MDIVELTKTIMDLFKTHEVSKIQSMFVLKAVEMTLHEEVIQEMIDDRKNTGSNIYG